MSKNVKIFKIKDKDHHTDEPILAERGSYPSELDKDLPLGENGLNTGLLFEERLYYKEKAFQQIENEDIGLIDIWNTTVEYGKTDIVGMPVYLSEIYLKQFRSANAQDLFAINYVVDLFEEMVFNAEDYIRKANTILPVEQLENQSMFPFTVAKAWQSATGLYHEHIAFLYEMFTAEYLSDKHSQILVFEHFVKKFIDFCHIAAEDTPITFSSFIQSSLCPINVNGYTIEVATTNYDNDEEKFSNFFLSPFFEIYRRMAMAHGFMIDKNVPSRLIANLNHPKMRQGAQREVMTGEDFTMKSLMNKMYKNVYVSEIEMLKFYMASFYNNYVKYLPTVDIPYVKVCKFGDARLHVGTATREPLQAFGTDMFLDVSSPYYSDYSDKFWLNFYYQIKIVENKINKDPAEKSADMRALISYYNTYGLQKTVKKIIFDINVERRKRNAKIGIFTGDTSDIIMYDKLYKYKPTNDPLHDEGDDEEMLTTESQMQSNTFVEVSTQSSITDSDTGTTGTGASTSAGDFGTGGY